VDIRALKCFIWTAELGNITRAAAELGLVQSALSRKLQALEQELGAPLLVRLPRGIQLTPAGQQFLGRARRILRELESARSEISNQAAVEGVVKLGLSPTLAPIIAPGCLEQVQRDFPDISLKVVEGFSSLMLEPLLSGRIDVAVLTNPPRVAGLRLEPAVSEEVVVVTAPGVRGIQPFYTLDELCRTPVLITSGFRIVVDDQLRKLGKQLAPGTEIDSVEAIRRIVARGRGVTLMPVSTYQDDIRAGRLDAFHIADASLQRMLVLAMPPENRTSPAMQKVIEVLGRQFTALVDEGTFSLVPRTRRVAARTRRASGRAAP
jgi:LysR family nitrogen assimilation transcriptional regulator